MKGLCTARWGSTSSKTSLPLMRYCLLVSLIAEIYLVLNKEVRIAYKPFPINLIPLKFIFFSTPDCYETQHQRPY